MARPFLGLPPVGALLAGELSRHIPTSHALAAMSGVCMVVFLGFYAFSKPLRRARLTAKAIQRAKSKVRTKIELSS